MKFRFTLKCAEYLNYASECRLLNSEPARCFNLLAPEFFFYFSTPVYKILIIQEPNKLEL